MKTIKQEIFVTRRATKEHICSVCAEKILKKEKYIFYAPPESDKKDMHLHHACALKFFKKGFKK